MLYKFLIILSIFSTSFVFAVDQPMTGTKRERPADPADIVNEQPPVKKTRYTLDKALNKACEEGDIEKVRALLNSDNINEKNGNGNTPILVACAHGHADIVEFLLSEENIKYININESNIEHNSLLHLACKNLKNNEEIIKKIIHHRHICINACNEWYQTPLYVACTNNNLSAVKELLKHPDTDVNFSDCELKGPLYVACLAENIDIVKELLLQPHLDMGRCCKSIKCEKVGQLELSGEGCGEIEYEDHVEYKNCLHLVCKKGNKELLKILLETHKIDADQLTTTFEHSLLTMAIKYNKPKIVKFLFKNGYGDIRGCKCGHGIFQIIKEYIETNKEISSDDKVIIGAFIEYKWGKLSLDDKENLFCSFIDNISNIKTNVAKFILENQKFDKSELLFYSCAQNSIDTVKILIENFNIAVNQQNKDNLYPLDTVLTKYSPSLIFSKKENIKNLIEYLLNKGAGYSESFDENENTKDLLAEIKLKMLENTKFIE